MINKQSGFTLLEALVVLAIAAILGTFALPSLGKWRKQATFKEASRNVSATLREARSLAVAEHWEHRVNFDVGEKKYQITRGNLANGSTIWNQVVIPWTSIPDGITLLTGENCTSSSDISLKFMPNGTCDSIGSSWDASRFICIMEGSTKKFRVDVSSKATGHSEIVRWDGAWKR